MKHMRPTNLILDLDGVLTDGKFYYDENGKRLKAFGVDDSDALRLIRRLLNVSIITADELGFEISRSRIERDMSLEISLVSAQNRFETLMNNFDLSRSIYMGDGLFDYKVFRNVFYSIAPSNSLIRTRNEANFVTEAKSGERAVAEACVHIAAYFFNVDLLEEI